jgi:hypothetical protein
MEDCLGSVTEGWTETCINFSDPYHNIHQYHGKVHMDTGSQQLFP